MTIKRERCKICRRLGTKLFLKGEKCLSLKCPIVKRPYPPGARSKKRRRSFSEYAKELSEKQKLKYWYNLKEYQFKRYVKEALEKRGRAEDAQNLLIKKLEKRLENVAYRLGFAVSRQQARQLVSHGFFLVNGKKVNISSYQVKKGDKITISDFARQKGVFQNLSLVLKKHQPPSWLKLDVQKMQGEVVAEPHFEEAMPPVEVSAIFEFYSR